MDIPNIQLIVQYKATCNLCMLWQWFGRAACGANQVGTVILLCEKKDIREEQRLKKEHAWVHKEKKEGIGMAGTKQKGDEPVVPLVKHSKASRNGKPLTSMSSPEDSQGDIEMEDIQKMDKTMTAQAVQNRQFQYHMRADQGEGDSWQHLKRKGHSLEENTPLFDFINPSPMFMCWQTVLITYFENDKIGK